MPQRVAHRKLYEQIVAQLEDRIISGAITIGAKLPPERQLSKDFGVSLTAIREAVHALAERGLVHVRHGSGTFVALPSPQRASETARLFFRFKKQDIAELMEARYPIELETASLAAIRRDNHDLERISNALDKMRYLPRTPSADPAPYFEGDIEFHIGIARAAHNEVFVFVLQVVHDLILRSIRESIRPADVPRQAVTAHEAILTALRRKDSEGAREAMSKHLLRARDDLFRGKRSPSGAWTLDGRRRLIP